MSATPILALDGPQPVNVNGGVAYVAPQHLPPPPLTERPTVRISFPSGTSTPVLGSVPNQPGHQLLRELMARGVASGNVGDLYENRDRGHSPLSLTNHPQMTELLYHPVLRDQNIDYGPAFGLLFDAPLIGNSSTAITAGPFARSLPRMALTGMQTGGATALYQNYENGQIHVYPSYQDHEAGGQDMFSANTPYYVIADGASGADQPHLEALAMILAAFQPDTKARLLESGLIAPTVQMVYRRGRDQVSDHGAYFTGVAHPTAFPASGINLSRMVALANAIKPTEIPPMVRLSVLSEPDARPGIDVFGEGLSEVLFDTPSAISRVWRAPDFRREFILSAADTADPNGRPLTFRWDLLRGNSDLVTIEPLGENGTSAKITIGWQDNYVIPGSEDVSSSRIDVGVFANNGAYDSAPAFFSVLLPHHETRIYELDTEHGMRIRRLVRTARDGTAYDPLIFPRTNWADDYSYEGADLTGWERQSAIGTEVFNAQGEARGKKPSYPIVEDVDGLPAVAQKTQ
ncbi:hypothetical protein [Aliiroseovarius sp. 2305UL8-7]|uniref:hypothetical protein n=1 Tax=Aliiroseovarius conchicola TaxID=3121637 RepID=UPI0035296A38